MIDPSHVIPALLALALMAYLLRGYLFLPIAWLFGHLVKLLIRFSGKGGL